MPGVSKYNFKKALEKAGVDVGNVLLVHSDVSKIGLFGKTLKDSLEILFDSLMETIAPIGTLAVPAYFYEYAKNNTPFDVQKSPISKELGLFPKYVNEMRDSFRSINPLTSIAAVGSYAEYLCQPDTGSSLGLMSSFDKLFELGAKMVFVGVDLSFMTFIHYIEHVVGVPYIYSKYFTTPVYNNSKRVKLPISAQVRYLDYEVQNKGWENTVRFEAIPDLVAKVKIGNDYIRVVNMIDFFDFFSDKLMKDFFYDLEKVPNFDSGKVPMK